LTFGYGSHQCMGKNLARMEMQIFLEELTRRLPHLKLAEQSFTGNLMPSGPAVGSTGGCEGSAGKKIFT
ncbi:hypothetical protein BMR85_019780, partial [Achromobacter sp. KAs 3-5]